MPDSIDFKRECIESGLPGLSVRRQCELLGLNRSSWYYRPTGVSVENLQWMRRIDEQYLKTPCYGSRKMARALGISRTRAQRLMRLMGLEAIYPKPHLSRNDAGHRIYPYLLRNLAILRPNQVWSSDITYVPMPQGWMYLTAVMDWFSRYVLSWRLSNTLDGLFCLEALEEALTRGTPEIFNTDQGVQYTATAFSPSLSLAEVPHFAGACLNHHARDSAFSDEVRHSTKPSRKPERNAVSVRGPLHRRVDSAVIQEIGAAGWHCSGARQPSTLD